MDKNAIKKYAIWARRELIERVSQRALIYGITEKDTGDPYVESVNGHLLSQVEKRQRQALIQKIEEKGYEQVMEEVAYTWFNRFAALRFMEVNGYLPSHIRVFTNDDGEFKPQILAEAIHMELDGLDMNKVYELESANKSEDLFKYLLIVQCNALNSILPRMFQRIEDYTELLLPDYLLREGSVIEQMVTAIPEADWTDQVQIIGWLYQYYNTELKDKVFADLKKNIKISKENIPAATQLFTPDWIVHYMVENSLGRLWLEGHPNDTLKSEWKYYLDEAEQEPEVQAQLAIIRKEHAALKPEKIRVIDPCMGSGHVLCVLFDVLVRIYEDYGYTAREAVTKIVENNLWGLDIDERAAQLSYFAVMMKARQYDRRFFIRNVQPHVYAIKESNGIVRSHLNFLGGELSELECNNAQTQIIALLDALMNAKEYGSLLMVPVCDWELLRLYAQYGADDDQFHMDTYASIATAEQLHELINIGQALAQKYDIVVTNPPYMGSSGMSGKLSKYVKKNYPDSKSDLFATFIERCGQMTGKNGYQAMITQHAWMFLSSFEKLRAKLQTVDTVNMAHLGARAFEEIGGEVVQTTSFVLRRSHVKSYAGTYCRLIEPTTQQGKEDMFLAGENRFIAKQDNYKMAPGMQTAYWVDYSILSRFRTKQSLYETHAGITTGDNEYFLHLWFEIDSNHIYRKRQAPDTVPAWYFHHKGGNYRKWYGNLELVIHYDRISINEMKTRPGFRHDGKDFYFRTCGTWNKTGTGNICVRFSDDGNTFNTGGCCLFTKSLRDLYYAIGLLNSNTAAEYLSFLCPTFSFAAGDVEKVPVVYNDKKALDIERIVKANILISRADWDAFETSWDFQQHPLIRAGSSIAEAFAQWERECDERFVQLRANEEKLNRIFIDIYGLQNKLSPDVADKDVTIRRANLQRDIRSFISYAVGCMLGRYSLDILGLAYAGGVWDASKYATFQPDMDAIIPICDDEYFEDDIVGRFVKFVEVVYGKEMLEENLRFIADALCGKGSSREVIRNYFINDFYVDHLRVYQKRPIYWLFDSGKKNGFKCLLYLHRYQQDTIARIRTDYVHEQQSRYRTAIADLEQRVNGASTSERVKLSKRMNKLQAQAEEIRVYEEKIHHLADQMIKIDLDDGVKHNYEIFKDVLAKIK